MAKQANTTEKFKTSVGGQALMEGIMMRGPQLICCAVRKPDGSIDLMQEEVKHHPWQKIPLVRGAFAMIESMIQGYRYLMHSAEISMGDEFEEEDGAFDKWVKEHFPESMQNILLVGAALAGAALALLLFAVIPTTLTGLVSRFIPLGRWGKVVLEAVLKMAIFICYLAMCSRMKEIKRLFQYHGAEHKTIACYEAGEELSVENIRKHTRFHPRCGTSFLILTLLISIFLYSVLPWSNLALRVVYKLLLLPVVMGISYELLKWCGRSDSLPTRIIRTPGLWVQRLTVFEPEDDMIEIAIAAVTPVLPQKPEEGLW